MTTPVITLVPAAELVEDYELYPRHSVDTAHIGKIARAMEAGIFDGDKYPVVADRVTKKITDGFHRKRAYQKVYGDAAEVPVEFRDYMSVAEMIEDATTMNADHGRPLDSQDQTRCALLLEKHGVSLSRIAVVLATTQEHVEKRLLVRVVEVKNPDTGRSERVPAKPVVRPSKGEPPRTITPEQAQVHLSSSGYRTGQTVSQLTRELRSGLIDLNASPGLREKLEDLAEAIQEVL